MKLSIHSDLHLEGNVLPDEFLENQEFDVLILAGDIVTVRTMDRLNLIRERTNKDILYVPGNHEFYHGSLADISTYRKKCEELNIQFLYRDEVSLNGRKFKGCTGWSDMCSYEDIDYFFKCIQTRTISDFYVIQNHSVNDMIEEAAKDFSFIDSETDILITHFPLSESLNNSRFKITPTSAYFVNDWLKYLYYVPKVSIFGHTHGTESNVYVNDTLCLSNQMGYGDENLKHWDPNYIVEI